MFKRSGWIFMDKPIGLTSNSLLQKVRLNLGKIKAGFVGTLDPLASGYLPIAIGNATKVINLAEKENKEYIFTICWGKQTDTGDLEGKVISQKKNFPQDQKFRKCYPSLLDILAKGHQNILQLRLTDLELIHLPEKK